MPLYPEEAFGLNIFYVWVSHASNRQAVTQSPGHWRDVARLRTQTEVSKKQLVITSGTNSFQFSGVDKRLVSEKGCT